jgi:glycosyltransferase involved in cell wall biosynthesis
MESGAPLAQNGGKSREMKGVTYISDLELRASGGGSYAVNFHAFGELGKYFPVTYGGPLLPRPPWMDSAISKLRRKVFRRPSGFHYFSPATLDRNAAAVKRAIAPDSEAVFFRSATRWSRWKPNLPYFVYLDAVFHTFFHNTFNPDDFVKSDLERIWQEEAAFLEGASEVFFESHWGMEKAIEAYGLRGSHYHAVGRGGVIDPPAQDRWDGQSRLLSVAMNFRQKGGDTILEAYKRLKVTYPELSWHVVGAEPEGEWHKVPGIIHEGVLRPDDPHERDRLENIFAQSFLLVHPTREDTNPLVLSEAAYFGCPAVTVNKFAIPELVSHGETGLLLDFPASADAIEDAISGLLEDRERYVRMRRRSREHALTTSSWGAIGAFMAQRMGAPRILG